MVCNNTQLCREILSYLRGIRVARGDLCGYPVDFENYYEVRLEPDVEFGVCKLWNRILKERCTHHPHETTVPTAEISTISLSSSLTASSSPLSSTTTSTSSLSYNDVDRPSCGKCKQWTLYLAMNPKIWEALYCIFHIKHSVIQITHLVMARLTCSQPYTLSDDTKYTQGDILWLRRQMQIRETVHQEPSNMNDESLKSVSHVIVHSTNTEFLFYTMGYINRLFWEMELNTNAENLHWETRVTPIHASTQSTSQNNKKNNAIPKSNTNKIKTKTNNNSAREIMHPSHMDTLIVRAEAYDRFPIDTYENCATLSFRQRSMYERAATRIDPNQPQLVLDENSDSDVHSEPVDRFRSARFRSDILRCPSGWTLNGIRIYERCSKPGCEQTSAFPVVCHAGIQCRFIPTSSHVPPHRSPQRTSCTSQDDRHNDDVDDNNDKLIVSSSLKKENQAYPSDHERCCEYHLKQHIVRCIACRGCWYHSTCFLPLFYEGKLSRKCANCGIEYQ